MTFEHLQELVLQIAIGLAETNKSLAETNKSLTRIKAIAEPNARAIQAKANKLDEKFDQKLAYFCALDCMKLLVFTTQKALHCKAF
jgi:hypothetical protein